MKKIFTLTILLLAIHSSYAQVAPLIQTQWNQDCYYNASLPAINGGPCGNAYTGCNATATAQIMKYYSFPSSGMGSQCNGTSPYTSDCVDFSTETYNYAAMSNTLTSANANVANLMYDVGVALNMDWGATASSSTIEDRAYALKAYFKYSPKMYYHTFSSYQNDTMALIHKMKSELDAGRPLIIDSPNHSYIIDGYNAANQFHCNFGWGGLYNGYYNITNVTNAGDSQLNPNYINFYITPMLDELEVNAGYGFDSTVTDTIMQGAFGGLAGEFEFSSTTNWTVYSTVDWFNINLTSSSDTSSGGPGYYHSNFVAINQANEGYDRTGYIIFKSTNEVDTIVVIQQGALSNITTSTYQPVNEVIAIKAYPNPVHSSTTIRVNEQALPGSISITDMQGKLIRQENMNQPEVTVDLSNVANGCYFVQFKNDKTSLIEKLVVMH